jgi:hypothetical protein
MDNVQYGIIERELSPKHDYTHIIKMFIINVKDHLHVSRMLRLFQDLTH